MKKKFVSPKVEVVELDSQDIIAVSGGGTMDGYGEGGE